ncbi:MAG TPA: TIGR03936 family radical SAM-associated protein [Acidimicrobiales bacterium]
MRVRFRFAKQGKVRFTSHRDVARLWERALRRAELPVAKTEGFSPRPKVHFGLALSTGHESLGEYLDVDFREPEAEALDLDALPGRLTPLLPEGLTVEVAAPISTSDPSLQQAVTSCSWTIGALGLEGDVATEAVSRLLGRGEVMVTRQRKGNDVTDDIRPYILHLAVIGPIPGVMSPSGDCLIAPAGSLLEAELATQPRGLRPSELLAALEPPATEGRVRRTHQWITLDGARTEPLSAGATSTTYAHVRAS